MKKRRYMIAGAVMVIALLTGCGQSASKTPSVLGGADNTVADQELQTEEFHNSSEASIIEKQIGAADQIQVSSDAIRRFLEGEGSASFTESYREFCEGFDWNFDKRYEGTIEEIREKCFQELAFLETQTIEDFSVYATDWRGGDFAKVTIRSNLSYGEEKYMIIKEVNGEIKICYEENEIQRGGWVCEENGIIYMGFRETALKYTQLCYYMNDAGDILQVYRLDHHLFVPEEETIKNLTSEEISSLKNSEYEIYLIGTDKYIVEYPAKECSANAVSAFRKQLIEAEKTTFSVKEIMVLEIEKRSAEVGVDFSIVSNHL